MEKEPNYADQKIILNEQLFRVEGEKLLHSVIHRSIGALTFLNKNKKLGTGTGALISRNLVLTSAHNIYDKMNHCENSEFQFYLGANGVAKEFYEIEGWRYLEGFKTCSANDGKLEFDYALLKLKQEVEYHHFLYLSFPCDTCLMLNSPSPVVEIFGYPGSYQNFKALDKYGNQMQLYQYGLAKDNRIVTVDSSAFKIGYGISTLPGQSGSPVVVGSGIIAIHSGGGRSVQQFNVGRLITVDLYHNLKQWTKELNAQRFSINKSVCTHLRHKLFKHKNHHKLSLEKKSTDIDNPSELMKVLHPYSLKEHLSQTQADEQSEHQLSKLNPRKKDEIDLAFTLYLSGLEFKYKDNPKAIHDFKQCIRIYEQHQIRDKKYSDVLYCLGLVHYLCEDFNLAAQTFENSLKVCEEKNDSQGVKVSAEWLAKNLIALNQLARVQEVIKKYQLTSLNQ